jgi:ketosteroid isomerase-like protein
VATKALILVAFLVTTVTGQQPATDEAAIRLARSRSNAAIAKHDVAGITAHWMPDVHIVTSTSAQGTGRDVNEQRMVEQFKLRPDTVYVRTPITVEVNTPWAVASERGEWTGRWTEPDGVVEIGGAYHAQWRKLAGVWLIQAELFVPTHCRGSAYCAKRP